MKSYLIEKIENATIEIYSKENFDDQNVMEEFQLFKGIALKDESIEEPKDNETLNQTDNVDYESIAKNQRVDYLAHLRKLKRSLDEAQETCQMVLKKIEGTENSVDGVSLLQVKNHCFVEYLESIAQLAIARTSGLPADDAIGSLVSNRCVLEKIKPLENQMRYQLQKYAEIEKNTSYNMRANPSSMMNAIQKAKETENFIPNEESKNMVEAQYRAPEVMSALYPKEQEDLQKQSRYAQTIKARSKQSVLMDEAAAQIQDTPLELDNSYGANIHSQQNKKVADFMKRMKEMEEIEEETMQRLPRSKKDRQMLKQIEQAQNGLKQILDFGKIESDSNKNKKKNDKNRNKKKKH